MSPVWVDKDSPVSPERAVKRFSSVSKDPPNPQGGKDHFCSGAGITRVGQAEDGTPAGKLQPLAIDDVIILLQHYHDSLTRFRKISWRQFGLRQSSSYI